MKKIIMLSLLALALGLFTGCGGRMPKKEELKTMTPAEFFDELGFYHDEKKDIYSLTGSKHVELDRYGSFTDKFEQLYKKRFSTYCEAQGGKLRNKDDLIYKFPLVKGSSEAYSKYSLLLSKYVKNWGEGSHFCTVNDIPIFSYRFSKYRDGSQNQWWNITVYAIPLNPKEFIKVRKIVDEMVKSGYKPIPNNSFKIKNKTNENEELFDY